MIALQNEGSHGNPTGVFDVRHTARKLITNQIITTDTQTRSRTGCCNYDVMCNRARYTKCVTNSGGQRLFDWAPFCSSTQRHDFTRCTIRRKAQLWHDRTPTKNSISVYFHKRDGVLTPKSIPAETIRYQERALLATLCACQTLLLPRERRQYNEVAISMVTTTRSTGYTKWRCLRRRKGRAIYREELKRKIQRYPVYT